MQWHEFKDKAYHGIYKARWYPRIYLPNSKPTLVYSTHKTGSQAIRSTLYRHGIGLVFWAHVMNRKRVEQSHQRLKEQGRKPFINRRWQDLILERFIEKDRPMKIVTSTRDMVARDLSLFFHRFENHHHISPNEYRGRFNELQAIFYSEFVDRDMRYWFEQEYGDVLGLNIYDHPFPHEQGYQVIQHKQFEILLLKLETPDLTKEKALSEFFEVPNIKMYMTNIGARKGYGDTYKDFRNYLTLPQSYIDERYDSREMQHFYTPDEIEQFRTKWRVT